MATMDDVAKTILCAKRRRFLRSKPIFECIAPVSEADLFRLATGLNFKFALGLSRWLLLAGYGDIDETLTFNEDCFSVMEQGPLPGLVFFARDSAGNRYAFSQTEGHIYCISSNNDIPARLADDFTSFMQDLIRRDFNLADWVGGTFPKK